MFFPNLCTTLLGSLTSASKLHGDPRRHCGCFLFFRPFLVWFLNSLSFLLSLTFHCFAGLCLVRLVSPARPRFRYVLPFDGYPCVRLFVFVTLLVLGCICSYSQSFFIIFFVFSLRGKLIEFSSSRYSTADGKMMGTFYYLACNCPLPNRKISPAPRSAQLPPIIEETERIVSTSVLSGYQLASASARPSVCSS